MTKTDERGALERGAEFELHIERMGHGGVGIGTAPDGRVCFVAGGFPGDELRVSARKVKKSFIEADLLEVISAGDLRVPSQCAAAEAGAGCCDFAELDPAAELDIKAEVLRDQLRRIAKLESIPEIAQRELPPHRGWRTRVRLGVDAEGRAGTRKRQSHDVVTQMACSQLVPGLVDGLVGPGARRFSPGAEVIAVLDSDGNRHVVESRKAPRGRRTENVKEVIEAPTPKVVQRADGHEFSFPPLAFWQAHSAAPEAYTDIARSWLAGTAEGDGVAWDLYGGVGLFVPVLAEATTGHTAVHSVDFSPAASASQPGLEGIDVTFHSAKVEDVASTLPAPAAVILDPPRTGAGAEVIKAIAQAQPARVMHVGCDPATFARDVYYWREWGYGLDKLVVVNAFPGTHHFETLALLVPDSHSTHSSC
ncbi:class I SAM-dependent RNA methyltransferase [Corynebacterium sp.]|uniref:class I SAM-dependent RNA methyltransferase n=1 Tax=Corynebacterium sp. TaxID=1720 RepID=UPI0026DCFC13|nr:TRAM domain-containing protein [Corynebacterium sp.]MDO5031722.1 TRAM domain-containing protein [Corynebacterium sp.]